MNISSANARDSASPHHAFRKVPAAINITSD
jgi:hypothetical protein